MSPPRSRYVVVRVVMVAMVPLRNSSSKFVTTRARRRRRARTACLGQRSTTWCSSTRCDPPPALYGTCPSHLPYMTAPGTTYYTWHVPGTIRLTWRAPVEPASYGRRPSDLPNMAGARAGDVTDRLHLGCRAHRDLRAAPAQHGASYDRAQAEQGARLPRAEKSELRFLKDARYES